MLKVNMEYEKEILYVRLKGELKHDFCYKINNYLIPVTLKHQLKFLVLNLSELKDLDSWGIEALLNLKCAVKSNKGKICLCEVPEEIRSKLKRVRLSIASNELAANQLIRI